jgi:D-alanine-D-alanine ligase
LNRIISSRRPHVLVFIAYAEENGVLVSPEYDDPYVRADVGRWMEALELQWDWVEIAHRTLAAEIERARSMMQQGPLVVLNLCDGDDVNGYPGLSVVKALEAAKHPVHGGPARASTRSRPRS